MCWVRRLYARISSRCSFHAQRSPRHPSGVDHVVGHEPGVVLGVGAQLNRPADDACGNDLAKAPGGDEPWPVQLPPIEALLARLDDAFVDLNDVTHLQPLTLPARVAH